jgi:hypothetical protein
MVGATGKRDVNDVLSLKELVRRKMHQAGGLAHTLSRGDGPETTGRQTAVDGTLEDSKGTPLYQL